MSTAPLPRSIGPYDVVGEIGRGGMGVVFRARDRGTGRDVALKVMLDRSPSDEATERFIREVRLLAEASGHPGIARIHHAGCLPDGSLYYAMEFIAGRSLQAILDGGPIAPDRAARYVGLAAEAIHHAHTLGVIHRDISPKNIIIDDAQDLPRLLDFGLAKSLASVTRLTATGTVLGTPAYMAPEQVEGGEHATPRTDVYALGATLYACLAGHAPYEGASALAVIARVAASDPTPLGSAVPSPLRAIAARAMARDPRDRYPTALDVARDLRAFSRGEAVSASSAGRWRRGRRAVVAATVGGVLAIALAAGWLVGHPRPGPSVPPGPDAGEGRPGDRPVPFASEVSGGPGLAADAARRFRDPAEVGEGVSLAFRALLPRRGDATRAEDPPSPFVLWARAQRIALGRAFRPPESPPPGIDRASADLDEARSLDPAAAWEAWAAARAATGAAGEVFGRLDRRPDTGGAALFLARLRLVRGEPEEALAALDGVAGDEARLLRGLAHLLVPDLEAARSDLSGVQDPWLRGDAAIGLALVTRVRPVPGGGGDLAEGTALMLPDTGNPEFTEAHLRGAMAILDDALASGSRPARLLALRARLLLEADDFDQALATLDEARAGSTDDPDLRDAWIQAADFALEAQREGFNRMRRFAGYTPDRATAALRAHEITAASVVAEAEPFREISAFRPTALAALSRWDSTRVETLPAERIVRGMDAMGVGLAGRFLDRATSILARNPTPTPDSAAQAARRLARMAHTLLPSPYATLLLAALRAPVSTVETGGSPVPPWVTNPAHASEMADFLSYASIRAGLDPPLLLMAADAHYRTATVEGDPLYLPRAIAILRRSIEGEQPGPETLLLLARCLSEEFDGSVAGPQAAEEVLTTGRRAYDAYRNQPLLERSAPDFLRELATAFDRAGSPADAHEMRGLIQSMRGAGGPILIDGFRGAAQDVEEASAPTPAGDINLSTLGTTFLTLYPFQDHACFGPLGAAYVRTGQSLRGLLVLGRLLRLGYWHLAGDFFPAFGGALDAARQAPAPESVDLLVGLALARLLDPRSTPEEILRGIGEASGLLAIGIAPGPLLSARAYGRLRLGDSEGAQGDAEAAGAAPFPGTSVDARSDGSHVERARRLAHLVIGLAAAGEGDEERAERALRGIDLRWLAGALADSSALDPRLRSLAQGSPAFEPWRR